MKGRSILLLLSWAMLVSLGHAGGPVRTPSVPISPPSVALITGSDHGIGFALAQEFVTRG